MARGLITARRGAAALTVGAVAALHVAVVDGLAAAMAARHAAARLPPPIEVAFVRELQPAEAPRAPARPPPRARPAAAAPPAAAASAPAAAPPGADIVVEVPLPHELAGLGAGLPQAVGTVEPPLTAAADAADGSDAALPAPHAAADAAPAAVFEWPPSTRLRYLLSGWYRGDVHGHAQVQWLRDGERYQVHLDVVVGPSFAPLVSRRMVSDGVLTDSGLRPQRYDELTQVAMRAPHALTLYLGTRSVQLAGGRSAPAREGMQDAASQFVQMTWLFTLQPERLQPGQVVEFPLVLPRRIGQWRYEVVGEERLDTPVGGVAAVHVRPTADSQPLPGHELGAEAWFAPSLQYLPVRIRIRQDAQTWVDLLLAELPQQSAPSQ